MQPLAGGEPETQLCAAVRAPTRTRRDVDALSRGSRAAVPVRRSADAGHTTTLSGRSDADDPRSLVVFYRSHLGGFGDLLQMLLRKRSPKHNALTIQSDLSTVERRHS